LRFHAPNDRPVVAQWIPRRVRELPRYVTILDPTGSTTLRYVTAGKAPWIYRRCLAPRADCPLTRLYRRFSHAPSDFHRVD
jgi:hypothetical protein